MQHNKYLEDLGIPIENIGTNFCEDSDKRMDDWKRQREEYGFDERETWNMDFTFIEWLYSHLMMYLETGGKVVDLDYHTFTFEEQEYTQREAIEDILHACRDYLLSEMFCDKYQQIAQNMQRAVKLFAEILPAMWW